MSTRLALALLTAFACTIPAHAQEAAARQARVRASVAGIFAIQNKQGEAAAISSLKACYQGLPAAQHGEPLEDCLARDVAYANWASRMYRNVLKDRTQPEYSTTAVMDARVLEETLRSGLNREEADRLLRAIKPMALIAMTAEVQAMFKSPTTEAAPAQAGTATPN